ncbi:protein kinase [Streptomyces buecherae]|uniref:protein kinase domain-containing protein n=1 Tax=Streptomyces buecherae TaxID=2763006 RepID=UPI0033E6CFE2
MAAARSTDARTTEDAATRAVDGRFELVERLGNGGMGLVWRARDAESRREVALKEMPPPDPRYVENTSRGAAVPRERVVRETRTLARLRQPRVVTVCHVVTVREGGFPWPVAELASGGSLADRLDRSPLAPVEAARWAGACSRGWPPRALRASRTATSSRSTC